MQLSFKFCIYLLLCAQLGSALADSGQEAVQALSRYRTAMGLSAVTPNAALKQAALGHSQYLSALLDRAILGKLAPDGTPEMHRQRAGNPKFTGLTIGDRTKRAGYFFGAGEQVVFSSAGNSGAYAVEELMATVYHRSGLLNPAWTELGAAVDTPDAVLVMGEGPVKAKVANDWIAVYPANQSTTARVAFQNEIPDPAPDRPGQWLGLPVSIHAAAGQVLQISQFQLFEHAENPIPASVKGRLLTAKNDTKIAKNEAFFMPEFPLNYNLRYEAVAEMTVVTASGSTPKTLRWTFQTPANPFAVLPITATTELIPGVPQIIELHGIQGNWSWQARSSAPAGTTIDMKDLGGGKIQISFPASCDESCNAKLVIQHTGPHPSTVERQFIVNKAALKVHTSAPIVFPKQLQDAAQALKSASPYSALAYSNVGNGWSWNTITGAPNQKEAEQSALASCNKNPNAANGCKLYPLTAP